MSIYKRGETWWIQFTSPNGERFQKSAHTSVKKEAQELHDKLKAEMWRVKTLKEKPSYLWQEVAARWLTEQSDKRSLETDKDHLKKLDVYLLDKPLHEIDLAFIDRFKVDRLNAGVKNATVNRTLALLRAIMNRAKNEWRWIDETPFVRLLVVNDERIRWLSQSEAKRLIRELPEHLAAMTQFSLATGLRETNVVELAWAQIDMQRKCAWISAEQAKGKRAIPVPLNQDAMNVILQQIGKHQEFVFTYRGNPVARTNNHAWRKALKRAGIKDFRWHDLRHTWASWHVQKGTPLHVLKELGACKDVKMVMRYAHLPPEHLAEYANRIESFA
jgi:integrase